MALNLVVAAITLWNTAYLDRALRALEEATIPVPSEYLSHTSPPGWEHITLTGTYHWTTDSMGPVQASAPRRRRALRASVVFLPIGSVLAVPGGTSRARRVAASA